MERKKLVYNAMQDLWKIANNDFANKSETDMTDEDWQSVIEKIDEVSEKYKKLRPEEEEFFNSICMAFANLIENEMKVYIEIPQSPGSYTWITPKRAKELYGIEVPEKKPNK
ncbi:MAG: hypothetical protein K6A23_07770 [Butyrivibrio sp.]|nr:hypothetical protein [Butyrivibrio sp.]